MEGASASPAPVSQSDDEALRPLSALLTHRLSTLTSVIAGHADLLVDAASPQEQRQIAMSILEAATQIDDLLADLHYYSRPIQPVIRPVLVHDVVHDVARLLETSDRERIVWEVLPPSACTIDADARLLHQALLGLLQNALDATTSSDSVLLRAALDEDGAVPAIAFEVWNEGVIELEDPMRIFQPFFTTRARHLGIGLSIVGNIAKRHGGTLQLAANSPAEGGTCLRLRLPREGAPPAPSDEGTHRA